MTNILLLDGHQPYPFAPGNLNRAMASRIADWFGRRGDTVRHTTVSDGYDAEAEVEHHRWADVVIMQFPVNWMGVPWSFKKYMDEVYTIGMDGRLCNGDGRSSADDIAAYGMGGTLTGTRYMLSLTFNAPAPAFDDPAAPFFEGGSVDDLMRPVHLNSRFFDMKPLPTFAAYDVMKNPQIDADFARLEAHLATVFETAGQAHGAA